MKNLFLIISLIVLKTGLAQSADSSVIVHKDQRLDLLNKKQTTASAVAKRASARSMNGYRLLIMNTNKREEAIDAKSKIYSRFPELKAYLTYQSPYFKVKAGNFKTREEAEKYRKNMSSVFPKGVFIVNDIIEVTPDKSGN